MGNYLSTSLGELVAEQPARARFFEKIGLDYCCGGNKNLLDACTEQKRDVKTVEAALEEFDRLATAEINIDWRNQPVELLVDHIVSKHHEYLREELPRLSALVAKVSDRHADGHPELKQLKQFFEVFRIALEGHLQSEEKVLFPTIKELLSHSKISTEIENTGEVLHSLIKEHDTAGADLQQIRKMTNNYFPPSDACNSYRAMLDGLSAMEQDIHEHIHKENNILFPRASALIEHTIA